jgi:hypothetical protein
MAFNTKIYDANQVSMVFMNIPIVSGYDDGEFLTIELPVQDFEVVTGTDGENTRYATNNRHAIIKLKLMQSSSGNAALSAILNIDKSTPGGAGVGPMLVRDRQGTSIYTASKCWIAKPPDVKFDRKPGPREWILECGDLVRLDGGN